MHISVNWIKDYVALPAISYKELAEKITLAVCEVEAFVETDAHLHTVVAVKVLSCQKHPNADKLRLTEVTNGDKTFQIVCGADNFDVGDMVPLAKIGTVLPGGMTIKKSKIRGEVSEGMLCGEDELRFSDNRDGLMSLPDDAPIGITLAALYPDMSDCILEIDNKSITHRPDLWGHYGFARECSVIFNTKLAPNTTYPEIIEPAGTSIVSISVCADTPMVRFSALEITGLRTAPSPDKIRHRLHRVGSKAINNLVDATNYAMLDCGQPMHAFDADQIPGNALHVRCATPGESLRTLQHKTVMFTADDVVIYDEKGPTAVAGIIGGERSAIGDQTTTVLLEAGCWNAKSVRKTSGRINTRTEASQRYEKSLDPELTLLSIRKALEILTVTNPQMTRRGALYDFRATRAALPVIHIKKSKIDRILGVVTDSENNMRVLTGLGFTITRDDERYRVEVPSWRATKDTTMPEDIIEEIGRIYGYNNIPEAPPMFPIEKPDFNRSRLFERRVKEVLAANGMLEIYTYPMNAKEDELKLGFDAITPNELLNPVVAQWHQMRTAMLPGILNAVREAQKISAEFNYFEIGKIYGKNQHGARFEHNKLMMAFSSEQAPDELFKTVKRVIDRLLSRLAIPADWRSGKPSKRYFHPNFTADVYVENTPVGQVFTFKKSFMERQELSGSVFVAEFDFDGMDGIYQKSTVPKLGELPKYPGVPFTISIVANRTDPFSFFADIIKKSDRRVERIEYVYEYRIPDFPEKKSLTVRIVFRDKTKTLNTEEANGLRDKAVKSLEKAGYRLRS